MGACARSLILEFLRQNRPQEWFAKEILRCLRTPELLDPHLKKVLFLRRLASDFSSTHISGDTLQCLELIEELDRTTLNAPLPAPAMCAAYCAVAAVLTVAPLRRGSEGEFLEAAHSIWECRLGDLEQSEARALMGWELREWREAIREAVTSVEAREVLLARSIRLEALGKYLEWAANEVKRPLRRLVACAAGVEDYESDSDESADFGYFEDSDESLQERLECSRQFEESLDGIVPAGAHGEEMVQVDSPTPSTGADERAHPSGIERSESNDDDEPIVHDVTCNTFELFAALPSVEIMRVRQALKFSCNELQMSVKDPLPCALDIASDLQISTVEASENPSDSYENANKRDASMPSSSFLQDVENATVEMNTAEERDEIPCPTLSNHDVVVTNALNIASDLQVSMVKTSDNPSVSYENTKQADPSMPSSSFLQDAENTTVEMNTAEEHDKIPCPTLSSHDVVVTNALDIAADLQVGMVKTLDNPSVSHENANQADPSTPSSSFLQDVENTTVGMNTAEEHDKIPCLTLPNRDVVVTSACSNHGSPTPDKVQESEDSIEGSSENSASTSRKVRMSTRNHGAAPLVKQDGSKFVRKRKIKRWTPLEEDTLRKAITRHGKGNWKFILRSYSHIFQDRTEIDLKDKWRNMTK